MRGIEIPGMAFNRPLGGWVLRNVSNQLAKFINIGF
jgi:hypothetical protein